MKKVLLFVALAVIVNLVSGQKSIDNLFEKYSGRDGFVTLTINGDLLKLLSFSSTEENEDPKPSNITQIRILAQDDNNLKVENFYDMVISDINLQSYEEFMRVKESDQDLRMLVRTEGDRFKEFLLIAGGEDNAVIQVKGNLTFKEAKKFSKDAKNGNGTNIVANFK